MKPVLCIVVLAIVTVSVTAFPADLNLNNEKIPNDERHDFSSLISQKKLEHQNATTTEAPTVTPGLTQAPTKVVREEPSSTLIPELTTITTMMTTELVQNQTQTESSESATTTLLSAVSTEEPSTTVPSETTVQP